MTRILFRDVNVFFVFFRQVEKRQLLRSCNHAIKSTSFINIIGRLYSSTNVYPSVPIQATTRFFYVARSCAIFSISGAASLMSLFIIFAIYFVNVVLYAPSLDFPFFLTWFVESIYSHWFICSTT